MICKNCGTENGKGVINCVWCGSNLRKQVMREHVASRVQNEAINKIRTGKVNYLNTVLGRHSSSGFDHKNLTKLDKAMHIDSVQLRSS